MSVMFIQRQKKTWVLWIYLRKVIIMALWFWRRFLNFGTFLLPLLAKECGPLLNKHHPMMLCAKIENWLKLTHWVLEKKVFNSCQFILFPNYFSLGRGRGPSLNKLEPPLKVFNSPFKSLVVEKKISIFRECISAILFLFHL